MAAWWHTASTEDSTDRSADGSVTSPIDKFVVQQRNRTVRLGEQRVEQYAVVALCGQFVGYVRPDEPGSAGDQYSHAPTVGPPVATGGPEADDVRTS